MAPLKVLISGAGIAGPGLVIWLVRLNCDITVVERHAVLRATGQQVDFRGQGVPLMRKMGIEAAVLENICHEPGMHLLDHRGRSKAYFAANKTGTGRQTATSEYEIMRGDLVRILYDATKDMSGVKYVFGVHIESFTQDEGTPGGKVHVTFSDGKNEDFDLLIGADGIGSSTRKLMLEPSFPDPRHDLGVHMAFYTIPSSKEDWDALTVCHVPGGRMILTRKDRPEYLRVYLSVRGGCEALDAADKSGDLEAQKRAWAERFKGTEGAQASRFLKSLLESPEADDLYTQHMNQIRLPEGAWSKGRVILLGDAAFCPTPWGGGLGTTAALVGAYVLAGEVARQCRETEGAVQEDGLARAAQNYEHIMRPFVTEIQNASPTFIKFAHPTSRWGIWILHTLLGLVALFRIDQLISRFSTPEEPGGFRLPDYPELD